MPDYTAIFTRLGAFARVHRQLRLLQSGEFTLSDESVTLRTPQALAAYLQTIFAEDGQQGRAALGSLTPLATLGDTARGTWDAIKPYCDRWLSGSLAPSLAAAPHSLAALDALGRAMQGDGESVRAGEVSVAQPSAAAHNLGNGAVAATSSTLVGGTLEAVPSQLVRNQSLILECASDNTSDGVAPGRESFAVNGASGALGVADVIPTTSGPDDDARNLVRDGCFADEDDSLPVHWSVATGTVFTVTTDNPLFGQHSLRIHGSDEALLTQTLSDREAPLPGGVLLALGVWARVETIGTGEVVIRVRVNETLCEGALTLDDTTPTGAWVHRCAWITMPRLDPADGVVLELATSIDFDGTLQLCGLSLAAPDGPFDGVRVAIFAGTRAFSRTPIADRFAIDSTNDEVGAFAAFLRDAYRIELPANVSPSVDDTLAI